ncbi:disulfide oxidoreductase [Bacillus testis]|uniref:disulfide oxidoreductase n=1 Tax=Bacillus testis TaxID=1622072 RepID=UPI00067E8C4D|nr:disulfide oxidoreductase [Bacillus testis]
MDHKKKENILFLAWAASVIATLGSLYLSEVLHWEPCKLCWFQRIAMYPMTVILGIAYVKKHFEISFYTAVLSCIGGLISLYHYSIQMVPVLKEASQSCGRVSCTEDYFSLFGFITIPFLALAAFIIIFVCSLIVWKKHSKGVAN